MSTSQSSGKIHEDADGYAGFDQLVQGCDVAIKAMVCRKWDAHNSFGKYLSTEFILSDSKGNSIQCSARSNISHRFVAKLVEGSVYSMRKFSVVPNRERYRIRKMDEFMISLEGYSIVKKISCPTDGFVRYPFELMALDDVDLNDSAYLVDVIGCVMEVGKIRTTSGGSELLDFEIMDERDARMRVTLWSPLCSELIKRKGCAIGPYIVILPAMNVKEFRGDLFLSSTSATILFDAPEIPQIAEFSASLKESGSVTSDVKRLLPSMISGTIYQLLRTAREQNGTRQKPVTFHCTGRVKSIQTKDGWFYFSCGLGGCKKRVSRSRTKFMCQTCSKVCEFPRTSYRLHLAIADPTGSVVVTMFDDVATKLLGKSAGQLLAETEGDDDDSVTPPPILALVDTRYIFEIKSNSYYDQGSYESFTVSSVSNLPTETLLPLKRSHTEMDGTDATGPTDGEGTRLANGLQVTPPLLSDKDGGDPVSEEEEG